MRKLSAKFMDDLVNPKGVLHPILARVKKDQTLMLAIREDFINIYYRGGNILNIKEHSKGFYQASFDDQYNESGLHIPDSPAERSMNKRLSLRALRALVTGYTKRPASSATIPGQTTVPHLQPPPRWLDHPVCADALQGNLRQL
jgi:hypothetical protein